MEKKLPSVFVNKIEKKITNNENIYKASGEIELQKDKVKKIYEKTVDQKINEILKRKKNFYKIPVKIMINSEEKVKYIIGKNKKNIITIENELIEIDKVEDIELYEEEKKEF